MMKIKVYSTPFCPYCAMAKEFLKKHNVKFEDIDVQENRAAAIEMIKKSGQSGAPVIEVDGNIIIGFDEKKLRQALEL